MTSTWQHLTPLLKYYPRRPCAPSLIKSRFFRSTTIYLLSLTSWHFWNSLYVYTRGLLGCLLGFWPLGQDPAGAITSFSDQVSILDWLVNMVNSHLMISFWERLYLFFATAVHDVQVNLKTMFQFQSKLVSIHFKSYKQSVNNLLFYFSISFLFRAVWDRLLAENIVLCSWARHFTLTVPQYPLTCINKYWQI